MLKHSFLVTTVVSLLSVGAVPTEGYAEEGDEHITITVNGEAKGKPDLMIVTLVAAATSGNAGDALSQCQAKADSASQAIGALGIPNAEVVREMFEFSSPSSAASFGMMPTAATPSGTRVSQTIKVTVRLSDERNTDTLATTVAKVLDAANKAGVGFKEASPWQTQMAAQAAASVVSFVLEDATALRLKAIDDCFAHANRLKIALANSGVVPGKLVSVSYYQSDRTGMPNPWMMVMGRTTSEFDSVTSTSPDEVTVRTSLKLRFSVKE